MREEAQILDLSSLRRRIRALERVRADVEFAPVTFGEPLLDSALPGGGLGREGLHEIAGEDEGAAALGFAVSLLRRAAGETGAILWCRIPSRASGVPYGPGLARFGLSSRRLLFVRARSPRAVLRTMEDGLRSGGLAAVFGENVAPDLTASRRLQLAAESTGTPAFVFAPATARPRLSAALTRWRVASAPGAGPRWRVSLWRCRGGNPKEWLVEWNDDDKAFCVRVAAPLAGGAVAAG